MSVVLLFLLSILQMQRIQGYVDEIPDPDFAPKNSVIDDPNSIDQNQGKDSAPKTDEFHEGSVKAERLSGYYRFMIKEILKRDLLSNSQRELFENAENVDPHSIAEVILGLIPDRALEYPQHSSSVSWSLNDLDYDTIQKMVVTYAVTVFCFGYMNKKCRHFLLSLHLVFFYMYAVYSRINKEYGEIKGKKLAAITNIPSHCKDHFSISSYFSLTWSKFQIGNQCEKYHQQVLTDPRYEIQYLKCFVYPFVSVLSTPLTVLGEELGPFLENVLNPFPFHLQIFILIFVSVILGGLIYLAITVIKPGCPPSPTVPIEPSSSSQLALMHKEVMQELVVMKREVTALKSSARLSEVTDIMLLNESSDSTTMLENIPTPHIGSDTERQQPQGLI